MVLNGESYKEKIVELILVRHGETLWNREGRFQGVTDIPLTNLGERDAMDMGLYLKSYIGSDDEVKIVSSPLVRAERTASIISDILNLDISIDERVIEYNYGAFEGLVRDNILDTIEFRKRESMKWYYRVDGGENYEMVKVRVESFLKSINGMEEL